MKKKISQKYLKYIFSFSLILIVSIASFNIFFDSYGYFESRYGIKSKVTPYFKPRIERVFKLFDIDKYNPDLVLLGSSRIAVGINPEIIMKLTPDKTVYNSAFSSGKIYEYYLFLKYIHETYGTQEFIIGLDYFNFKQYAEKTSETFNKNLVLNNQKFIQYLARSKENLRYLFSANIFANNVRTIFNIQGETCFNHYIFGSSNGGYLSCNFKNKGFYHINNVMLSGMAKKPDEPILLSDENHTFKTLSKILDYAQKNKIKITFIINAFSSDYLDALNHSGELNRMFEWKTFLTKEIYAHNQNKNFKLWDFAYYNKYTTSIRKNTDKEIKGYYWEASHYTKELGDIIITQIYGDKSKYNPAANDLYHNFGLNLTPENVNAYVNEMKKEAVKYYRPLNQNPSLKKSDIIINQS